MASKAINAQGVVIARGDGGTPTEVFTAIAEISDFNGPSGAAAVIDCTNLSSTAKEKRMGLPDEGQITIQGNLVPGDTSQEGMRSDRANRTLRNFKITLTDPGVGGNPTTLTFAAYVSAFNIQGKVDDKLTFSATLEISGPVTWTAAS